MRILSTFSPGMIAAEARHESVALFEVVSLDTAKSIAQDGGESSVGHPATAAAMSELLGMEVPFNRGAVQLKPGDSVLVFQVDQSKMGRLAEGELYTKEQIQLALKPVMSNGSSYPSLHSKECGT